MGCVSNSFLRHVKPFNSTVRESVNQFSKLISRKEKDVAYFQKLNELSSRVLKVSEKCFRKAHDHQDFSYFLSFRLFNLNVEEIEDLSRKVKGFDHDLSSKLKEIVKRSRRIANIDGRFKRISKFAVNQKLPVSFERRSSHTLKAVDLAQAEKQQLEEFVKLLNTFSEEDECEKSKILLLMDEIKANFSDALNDVENGNYYKALCYGNVEIDLDKVQKLRSFFIKNKNDEVIKIFNEIIKNYIKTKSIIYHLTQVIKGEFQFDAIDSNLSSSGPYSCMMRLRNSIEQNQEIDQVFVKFF